MMTTMLLSLWNIYVFSSVYLHFLLYLVSSPFTPPVHSFSGRVERIKLVFVVVLHISSYFLVGMWRCSQSWPHTSQRFVSQLFDLVCPTSSSSLSFSFAPNDQPFHWFVKCSKHLNMWLTADIHCSMWDSISSNAIHGVPDTIRRHKVYCYPSLSKTRICI